ncbi:MAG: GNAT family N-acetyltransferase [Acidimicrobiia bacterium]|nr:GNAT family N-acetyltransferase [Acidimicrobiia bacterium]
MGQLIEIIRTDQVSVLDTDAAELLSALHDESVPWLEFVFAARSPADDDVVLVARHGDRPVGYIAASVGEPGSVEVWEHVVVPAQRNRGVGAALLVALAERVDPGSIIRIDPAGHFDAERIADYYGRLGFAHRAAHGDVWATAAEVRRAVPSAP